MNKTLLRCDYWKFATLVLCISAFQPSTSYKVLDSAMRIHDEFLHVRGGVVSADEEH